MTLTRNKSYDSSHPILYLVATPIGNTKDFSLRAIEVLKSCDLIGCEDTRTSKNLFNLFDIHAPLVSCHEHNEIDASSKLITALLNGKKVAYVSDAGYPGISDPGHRLVLKALSHDINIVVINGSTAFLPALIASGLECEHFYFHGFLPSNESARKNELNSLKIYKDTLIFYESPHRIMCTLENLYEIFGDRFACIAREISKVHEEYIRGYLSELVNLDSYSLIGEMVIVVEGNKTNRQTVDDEEIIKLVDTLLKKGLSNKTAVKIASDTLHVPKNHVYELVLKK